MGCINCSCKVYPRFSADAVQGVQRNIMVIGESPTVQEVMKKQKMTGAGAQVLRETMVKVGLPATDAEVYFTTAIKCAVPKKKGQKFPKDAPGCCRQILLDEVARVMPIMILVCGATALQTLTGAVAKISEEYGRVRTYDFLPLKDGSPIKVIPIMNPGVLIHSPGDYKPFLTMMQLASTIYNGGTTVDTGETKWVVCDTKEKCVELWRHMHALNKPEGRCDYVAFDTETTGLDYRVAEFLVMGICFEKNHVYIIPREMRGCIHNFIEGVPWRGIWQHGKYDKKVLWRRGLANVPIDEDTLYQHYVLDETSEHNLGYLSKVYLNAEEYKYKMNQNWKSVSLETYPQFFEALCERVAVDCDYSFQIFHKLNGILSQPENAKLKTLYKDFIIPAANFLSRVEQNGLLINPSHLEAMGEKYIVLLDQLKKEIQECASLYWDPYVYQQQSGSKSLPSKFNPGSSQQMAWMVFDRLKLRPRIKHGRSTDKDVLKSIEDPPKLITKVLAYRGVVKEYSTYVKGLLEAMDDDGCVRTNFNLHVTATGRLSSNEPNVQNQPAAHGVGNVRKAFIAPDGYVLAEIDYSGAELRWLATLSRCPVLTDVFTQGRNLHVETATALFGPLYTKPQKMQAKAVNFGIPYGREAKSIAEEFNITTAEAQQRIDAWLNNYHGARDYLQWCADQVIQGNYLETPFGRRRRFGLVTPASLGSLQNEAKNFVIQSSSSDLLLRCAMEVEELLRTRWGVKILNLIHDSMLLLVPANATIIKEVGLYVGGVMKSMPVRLFNIQIPFTSDYEIGRNWGELVSFKCDDEAEKQNLQIEYEVKTKTEEHIVTKSFEEWYKEAI